MSKDTWIIVIGVLIGLLLLFFGIPASAHTAPTGWSYDIECCSSIDCAPVEDGTVEEQADGVHVKGYGVLSYSDPRLRWSRDDQDHLCIQQYGERKLLCVYRKPKGY